MTRSSQPPALPETSNPFARGYDNLHIERLLQITYANDCPPCFRPYTTHKPICPMMR
jgi:hypothetical protein